MTAFRPLDPFQVYTDLNGNLAAGGNLHFYAAGTTTDVDVYGDEGLTVNNGPSIAIGTDGRAVDDIWADGTKTYRCRIYGADGTLIRDRDNIGVPGSGGLVIPSLVANEFLTNDGAVLLWNAIRQLPDPTGQSGKLLSNDGSNFTFVAAPTQPTSPITVTPDSFHAGSGVSGQPYTLIQCGSGSAPANGTWSTNASITFGTAYATTPFVFIIPTTNTASAGGIPTPVTLSKSLTGFSAFFNNAETGSGGIINNPVTFDWIAIGTVNT